MGCCFSGGSGTEQTYDQSGVDSRERLRELQAQAAEKRMKENESRGIKNIESVRRQQAKKEQTELAMENQAAQGRDGNLKWQVG